MRLPAYSLLRWRWRELFSPKKYKRESERTTQRVAKLPRNSALAAISIGIGMKLLCNFKIGKTQPSAPNASLQAGSPRRVHRKGVVQCGTARANAQITPGMFIPGHRGNKLTRNACPARIWWVLQDSVLRINSFLHSTHLKWLSWYAPLLDLPLLLSKPQP